MKGFVRRAHHIASISRVMNVFGALSILSAHLFLQLLKQQSRFLCKMLSKSSVYFADFCASFALPCAAAFSISGCRCHNSYNTH